MARILRYPTGVRPLLIEAAARRRRVEQRFTERLEAAGFAEIILPILDYVDAYAGLGNGEAARRTYRFTDRDGDLVSLRSDFTPMVARALAPAIGTTDFPLRIYYRGDVIRCDRVRLGSNREMFQIGAEIIGNDSIDADVEVLTLAAALSGNARVVYTDARVAAALPPAVRESLATKRSSNDALATRLLSGSADLNDIRDFAPEAADRLAAIATRIDDRFKLDLADTDDASNYYTGLRFAVYDATTRAKVAQGGRYDTLYERFGAGAPAIGFTFTIDDLD
jgi:ATP phosphoribosyltransferase regulatory subunit